MAEVGMGIWRYLRYLLRWSCEMEWNGMEWNGMNKDEMKMLQEVFCCCCCCLVDSTSHMALALAFIDIT